MFTETISIIPNANRPSVSFVDATGDRTLVEGYNLQLGADASDNDGTVESVGLYVNDSLVRQIETAPYSWGDGNSPDPGELNGLLIGTHTIKVVATDNDGHTDEASFALTVKVREEGDICYFDTPRTSGLPQILRGTYAKAHVLGSGGPTFDNFRKFSIRWKPKNNTVYKFAINTDDGNLQYYVDLLPKITYQLENATPEISISDSGIENLDDDY